MWSVETREVLKQLDAAITAFLRHLSPYFLLRPAHKCFEWLIRAYNVHKCNIDAVMECILPYYETNLFARVVQLLWIKDDPFWSWLHPLKKEGVPLSRLTLVERCLCDIPFLVFVCNMALSSLSVHRDKTPLHVMISFYCSTISQVLERGPVTEDIVNRLLPFLLKGLKSSNVDYRASSYVIVSLLASKVKLDKKVTVSLMESVSKVTEVFVALTLSCQSCSISVLN